MTKAKNKEFMQLYEAYHKELSHFCRSLEDDPEDAKELMSETICRAFTGFEKLKDPTKFKSFLFGIASNTLKEFIRKKYRTIQPRIATLGYSISTDAAENHTLNQIMAQIPTKQAEVFVLFEIVDMSLADIAKTLETNLSTVKTRLRRAREALAALLNDEFKQHITNY